MPEVIEKQLNGLLGKRGYRAERAKHLPEKLLAARAAWPNTAGIISPMSGPGKFRLPFILLYGHAM